jgi:hypothetical protein
LTPPKKHMAAKAKGGKSDWGQIARSASEHAHRSVIEDYKAQVARYEKVVLELEDQLGITKALKGAPTNMVLQVRKTPQSEAVAVAVASDWHVEETVEPGSVNGLNDYNLKVADQRIAKLFESVVRLTDIERGGSSIDTCVLFLGGDLMSGYIHEELMETNALSPTETILWLQERIVAGIELLQQHFKRILVPCCFGNHGRTTKKPRHATGYRNSYEWLLYQVLSQRVYEGTPVEFQVADSYFNFVKLFGKVIRFHHGDNIRYQGGVGGLTIPVEKAISNWNRAQPADLDVFGHWHQQQQNPKWCSNGSLIGYNAYALSIKAQFEPPQQTYFLFDHKRGRTITAPIIL